MDEFADLRDGSGDWQNIQLLLESKHRQERRIGQLEQRIEELQQHVNAKPDKSFVQRSIQMHWSADEIDTNAHARKHHPPDGGGTDAALAKTVEVLQHQIKALDERVLVSSDAHLCLATERRVQYIEEELRLIVPIIDKKADMEAIHGWLSQSKDNWKDAMKKRLKTSTFEREVQKWNARMDQIEATVNVVQQHTVPETKAQLHQMSTKLHQHEATLARLAYFVQKGSDAAGPSLAALQTSVAELDAKLRHTMTQTKAQTADTVAPSAEPGHGDLQANKAVHSNDDLAKKIDLLETQLAVATTREGARPSRDSENVAVVDEKVHQLTEILHGFVSDIQIELEQMQAKQANAIALEQRVGSAEIELVRVSTTVQELITAMSQLVHHLPSPAPTPHSPSPPEVGFPPGASPSPLLADETAQLLELEALLAASWQNYDPAMVLGPQSQLEQVRDQLSATINEPSTPLRDFHQMLHRPPDPHAGVAQALSATLAHCNSPRSQSAIQREGVRAPL
ncbi:hypothetical protein, variant 1 [Aphanomyces invadans]|uniref:Uncharacterized protein n=1 Tax=Aphanomyces invadans TaxID=157072 RepID=A0A024TL80_9STRA|nr:hypothetical protein, variant 1 [Aphanomyces invadans]ETV94759.1 hypothetical protein, variant 1 [Aphanomyces invadans]|eukprot:XP_008876703.1 hypothetical protein, variant 1 [Aphanomyces invadans]